MELKATVSAGGDGGGETIGFMLVAVSIAGSRVVVQPASTSILDQPGGSSCSRAEVDEARSSEIRPRAGLFTDLVDLCKDLMGLAKDRAGLSKDLAPLNR